MKQLPKVGEKYSYFDDGKIKESRKLIVTITNIIPYNEIDSDTLSEWNEEVKDCDWLYSTETDFFINGFLKTSHNSTEDVTFVRTKDGGWFSLGIWGGSLDVDGELLDKLNKIKKVT